MHTHQPEIGRDGLSSHSLQDAEQGGVVSDEEGWGGGEGVSEAEGKGDLAGRMMELVTQSGNPCGPPLLLVELTLHPGAGAQRGWGWGRESGVDQGLSHLHKRELDASLLLVSV